MDLTAELARELIHYDPASGRFWWRIRPESMFEGKKKGCCVRWNNRYAGHPAGAVHHGGDGRHYWSISINGKGYLAHRLAWLICHGRWPDGNIDHRDGDGLNNRIDNLREGTQSQNMRNQRLRRSSRTGVCGVSWRGDMEVWRAYLGKKHLGTFRTLLDAVAARRSAELGQGFTERHGKSS